MPIYEYKCKKCHHIFDAFQRVGEDGSYLKCPQCGAEHPEKLLSSFASSGHNSSSSASMAGSCGTGGFG